MNIISKECASNQGLPRYYTGIPCKKHNHLSERLTSSGECIECKRLRERTTYSRDPSGHQAYYVRNRDRKLAIQREADAKRKEEKLAYGRAWRQDNQQRVRTYRSTNAGLYAYHAACRRKRVKQATPIWAELDDIKQLYIIANQLYLVQGVSYEVDHIIPLAHPLVCGLHCLANLCILTEADNRSKRNTYNID